MTPSPNTPAPAAGSTHKLCKDAWSIPPSPLMLKHGNDYYTCSVCGKRVEPPQQADVVQAARSEELRKCISEILVKWDMPTRQAAINEIMHLIAAQNDATYAAVMEGAIRELRQLHDFYNEHPDYPGNIFEERVKELYSQLDALNRQIEGLEK